MGSDALPTTSEIAKIRNADDHLGISDGIPIHIFAGRAPRDETLMLLEQMKRQMIKGDFLKASHISADPNYLSTMRDSSGAFRIISACMCVVSIGALLDTVRLLIEYLKLN